MEFKQSSTRTAHLRDEPRHRGMRQRLVAQLKNKGIRDAKVLNAMLGVPRHYMIDAEFVDWAYRDIAFAIESQQTISMPNTVALQSQLLEIEKDDKVLEVGTGSGYQAAVLHVMGAKIYTIERHRSLFLKTSKLLNTMGYHGIRTLYGDGYEGAERFAPFDKIIVTAGSKTFPNKLLAQLKIGGKMVIPMEQSKGQVMMRYIKTSEVAYKSENHGPCSFVPMLSGVN